LQFDVRPARMKPQIAINVRRPQNDFVDQGLVFHVDAKSAVNARR
jgi:hypothetical protein